MATVSKNNSSVTLTAQTRSHFFGDGFSLFSFFLIREKATMHAQRYCAIPGETEKLTSSRIGQLLMESFCTIRGMSGSCYLS